MAVDGSWLGGGRRAAPTSPPERQAFLEERLEPVALRCERPANPMATSSTIRRTADFRRVVRDGRRVTGTRLMAYVHPAGETRSGFVARREVGGAVLRNRARRLLRESWRGVAPALTGPVEVVFVARPAIVDARMQDVAKEMRELLASAGVIRT